MNYSSIFHLRQTLADGLLDDFDFSTPKQEDYQVQDDSKTRQSGFAFPSNQDEDPIMPG